jgi:PAS domain S-box-containing protein
MIATLSRGRPVVVDDVRHDPRTNPVQDQLLAGEIAAFVTMPYLSEGAWRASIAVRQAEPRVWRPDELDLLRDVTSRVWPHIERTRVEQALTASEARFRQLADAMPQIVFSARPDGQIDYFNRQWYSYTGLSEDDDDSSWMQVHTPEGLDQVARAWPAAVRSGRPYEVEYPLRRHDGQFRWHLARALPIHDDDGRIVRWFGTNTDIHDRKQIEQSLQESEARFRGLSAALASEKVVLEMIATGSPLPDVLDSIARSAEAQSSDGMLCSVMLLDPSGRHLSHGAAPSLPEAFNQAVDGFAIGPSSGSCGAAAQGQCPVHATDIATDPRWADHRQLALDHGLGACCSTPIIGAHGRVLGTVAAYYRQAHAPSPHDLELVRTATHLAGIVLDKHMVDERLHRSLEAEQDARALAERSGRMKDEFLATLSHELRTPMSAILGWARLMQSPAIGPADMAQGVEVIERNARAQAKIIEDLLDMSAIISGKVRLSRRPMDLTEVVRTALETARPTAEAKQIDLRLLSPPPHGPIIEGDANRLQQVMWNLINNAIKFTPPKGRIAVEVLAADGGASVKVADTGKGIRPEFIPYVFDRFRQADASTTRRFGGLGLGLSIVKQLVEIHGGSVAVNSAGEDLGSTFVITLPLTAVDNVAASLQDTPRAPSADRSSPRHVADRMALSGMQILVVDDDADARELIRRILADREAVVRTAASADEALALLGKQRFDVMVSDIGMPGEDGYSLIRRVRSLEPRYGGDTPAIALTAYARSQDRNDAIQAGFERHLAKPVDPIELVAAVGLATKAAERDD